MKIKMAFLVVGLILSLGGTHVQAQHLGISSTQAVVGYSPGQWGFMTAWNLSTGGLQQSSSWRTGTHRFDHAYPTYRQWIARFVYNQSTGRTTDMAWFYGQPHVQ